MKNGPKTAPRAAIELSMMPSSLVTKIFAPGLVIIGSAVELHDITQVAAVAVKFAEKILRQIILSRRCLTLWKICRNPKFSRETKSQT